MTNFSETDLDAALDTGTNATVSYVHWESKVLGAATDLGADISDWRSAEMKRRLRLWFESGEPVWMAASSLKTWSDIKAENARAVDRVAEFRRVMIRMALVN